MSASDVVVNTMSSASSSKVTIFDLRALTEAVTPSVNRWSAYINNHVFVSVHMYPCVCVRVRVIDM